ncbi:hypothetical protein TH61_17375 [Rufibacter sp. DG15C]|uniref:RHS repeat protein n=1 Tax=Rufibacter sp. DG15C TaxID=1379909 RepID=UPI00078B805A|nr:RHS repeat protein [Rufibacter sp. DG15C]AMM52598.1 hypothetical protein TH61_17375 [Rufibacter sp. DG15C]
MKRVLPFLLLLISAVSCTEEDPKPTKKVITEINTLRQDGQPDAPRTFTYDESGLLKEYRHYAPLSHEYNPAGRLIKVQVGSKQEKYTYDAAGRLATSTTLGLHDTVIETGVFFYDATGRMERMSVLERMDWPEPHTFATHYLLTYDASGNVIRQDLYRSTSLEELGGLYGTMEAVFDGHRNPLRVVGSPNFGHHHFHTNGGPTEENIFDVLTGAQRGRRSLISFLSPNNAVSIKYTNGNGVINPINVVYRYDGEGDPIEMKVNERVFTVVYENR